MYKEKKNKAVAMAKGGAYEDLYAILETKEGCNGVAKLPRPSRSAQTRFTTSTRLYGFILLRTKR